MPKISLNPDTLFDSVQYGFSQIVVAEGRRTIYWSGQVAWDEKQNIWMDKTAPVSEGLKAFFPGDNPPAATWIGVLSLARPEFLIEIEGTTVLD